MKTFEPSDAELLQQAREAKHNPTGPRRVPSMEELEEWVSDCGCEATDGCWVEPDGTCEHGHPSWLLYLNMI